MTVTLTWAEVIHGATCGVYRQVQNLRYRRKDHNGAEREDPWRVHINGACAELAVAKALGKFWSGMGALGNLRADDFVGGQARWVSDPSYRLIIQPKDPDDQPVVLVSGDPPTYHLHGWYVAGEAKRQDWWEDPQHTGRWAYFVPRAALHAMTHLTPKENT